jgi:hypothetical protein
VHVVVVQGAFGDFELCLWVVHHQILINKQHSMHIWDKSNTFTGCQQWKEEEHTSSRQELEEEEEPSGGGFRSNTGAKHDCASPLSSSVITAGYSTHDPHTH